MQRNICPVCGGAGSLGQSGRCPRIFCEEGAFPIMSDNKVNVIFPAAGGIVLDISLRQDHPDDILQDLRRELACMAQGAGDAIEGLRTILSGPVPYVSSDRYADVIIRAQHGFLALLRLMRWNVVFNFQEVTGLPWPRHFRFFWKRSDPKKPE